LENPIEPSMVLPLVKQVVCGDDEEKLELWDQIPDQLVNAVCRKVADKKHRQIVSEINTALADVGITI
jgi:hypothetical protein